MGQPDSVGLTADTSRKPSSATVGTSGKPSRTSRLGRSSKTEKPGKAGTAGAVGKASKVGRPSKTDKPDTAGTVGKAGKFGRPSKVEKPGKTGTAAKRSKFGRSSTADKPGKTGRKTAESGGQTGEPAPTLHWRTPAGRAAKTMLRSLAVLLLALGVFEILRITLIPTPGSVAYSGPDMHPFATIRLYLRDGTVEEQVFQIGGNIAMGFLLGFLLPQITPYLRGLIRVEAATAVLIAGVEAIQHFFIPGTSVNVDDLILAGIGAALGYLPLGRMFGMRLHPHHLHWWQQILARLVRRRRGARSA